MPFVLVGGVQNNVSASITSSTLDRKGRSNIFVKNGKVYLKVLPAQGS